MRKSEEPATKEGPISLDEKPPQMISLDNIGISGIPRIRPVRILRRRPNKSFGLEQALEEQEGVENLSAIKHETHFTYYPEIDGYKGEQKRPTIFHWINEFISLNGCAVCDLSKTNPSDGIFKIFFLPEHIISRNYETYFISPEFFERPFTLQVEVAGKIYLYPCNIGFDEKSAQYYFEIVQPVAEVFVPIPTSALSAFFGQESKIKVYFSGEVVLITDYQKSVF